MAYSSETLTAIFPDNAAAENAAQQLIQNGFNSNEVEVMSTADFQSQIGSGGSGLSGAKPHDTSGGGISGFFHRMFGSDTDERDRKYYSEASRRGQAAVIVHTEGEKVDRAANLLNRSGAIEIDDKDLQSEKRSMGTNERAQREQSIPVVQEELQVGKRAVQRGAVRIHSHVTDRPVEENVNLREERVRVDRRPADRPATQADLAAADREVIEFTETVEEPVVNKRARVVEEVVVGKDVRQRTETVRDNVRQSEVEVEDTRGDQTRNNRSALDTDFENDFRTRYGSNKDLNYEDYAPGYWYGYEMASDPRYQGRSFSDVESDLRSDYSRRYPGSTWDRMKNSIQYGWDKVTGKRS
jgi:uncharacterized protein (TIGR02271 family)